MLIYAKSQGKQTLKEHTDQCLAKYNELKLCYPDSLTERDWKILRWAILFHDFGKIDAHFQNKIRKVIGEEVLPVTGNEYPHNYLSPAFLDFDFFYNTVGFRNKEMGMLVKIIFYHHAREEISGFYIEGLQDYIKSTLSKRWELVKAKYGNQLPAGVSSTLNTEFTIFLGFNDDRWLKDSLQERYMKMKGMLNRIDYCASAGLKEIEENPYDQDGKLLSEKTESYMEKQGFQLYPVQSYLQQHSGENVIVQAGTGSGKTEGALLWLNGRKGFYTLPLKASINAIYKRINQSIGYTSAAVLHSDAASVYLEWAKSEGKNEEQALEKYQTAKLFATPFTVCTVDQLFRFVYKANGTEIAAATLACSNLVIDEIQMYSPELIASILYALHLISDMGGHFCIMTATFPKVLLYLMRKRKIPCPDPQKLPNFHSNVPYRHRIKLLFGKEFPLEQICKQAQHRRVLILVNRVTRAQEIQGKLEEIGVEANILHSRYLRKDRRILEAAIQHFAPNDIHQGHGSGIWISTQVVEASLDLDFDVMYTEMCTADSLLQRMGRVYRHRLYDLGKEPNVYILVNRDIGNYPHNIIDPELYQYTLNAIQEYDGCLLYESDTHDDKSDLMDLVYDPIKNSKILKSKYCKSIREKYCKFINERMYEKTNNEVKFRDINSITVIPKNVYEQLQENGVMKQLQMQLRNPERIKRLKAREKIWDYTITVPNMGLDIEKSKMLFYDHSQIYLYNGDYKFDPKTGKGAGLINKYKSKKDQDNFNCIW